MHKNWIGLKERRASRWRVKMEPMFARRHPPRKNSHRTPTKRIVQYFMMEFLYISTKVRDILKQRLCCCCARPTLWDWHIGGKCRPTKPPQLICYIINVESWLINFNQAFFAILMNYLLNAVCENEPLERFRSARTVFDCCCCCSVAVSHSNTNYRREMTECSVKLPL